MIETLIKIKLLINKINRKKQNILFLDFDGVINIGNDFKNNQYKEYANADCINNLNKLCKKFNLEIVITSSFRFNGLDYCKNYLYKSGLDKSIKIIAATQTEKIMPRHLEIFEYIKSNNSITNLLILDDTNIKNLDSFFIQTNFDTGFNEDCFLLACNMLSISID